MVSPVKRCSQVAGSACKLFDAAVVFRAGLRRRFSETRLTESDADQVVFGRTGRGAGSKGKAQTKVS
jgi:hypothetical protein